MRPINPKAGNPTIRRAVDETVVYNNDNKDLHIDSILETCKRLDFTPVKHALLAFFSGRRANAASISTMSIPSTSDMDNPLPAEKH